VVERLVLFGRRRAGGAADVRMILPRRVAVRAQPIGEISTGNSGTLAERTEAFERDVLLGEIRRHNFHMTNVCARDWGWSAATFIRSASSWELTFNLYVVPNSKARLPFSVSLDRPTVKAAALRSSG